MTNGGDHKFPPQAATSLGANLREFTTTAIALAVTAVTLFLLFRTFLAAGTDDFNNKKDVMLYGLSLVGVVMGYYFGRVPLERRVDSAEKAANTANKAKDASEKKVQEAKEAVSEIKGMLAPADARFASLVQDEAGPSSAVLQKLEWLYQRL